MPKFREACLTCDKFATDASFLPDLQQQKGKTLHLIGQRQQAFRARTGAPMGEDNIWLQGRRREAASLEAIIATLQHQPDAEGMPGPQQAVRGAGVTARTAQVADRAGRQNAAPA